IAVIFYFANVPDIKAVDDYHLDAKDDAVATPAADREFSRGLVFLLLWLNSAVLIFSCGMILWVILSTVGVNADTTNQILWIAGVIALASAAAFLAPVAKKISHHS